MRILIISPEPWRKDNSFGNTYSSIFGQLEQVEIAHVYLLDGQPDLEPNVVAYYHIPESDVTKSLFRFGKKRVGYRANPQFAPEQPQADPTETSSPFYKRVLSFGKRKHWPILFFFRELVWKYGRVNYKGLMDFVNDFKPDLFFMPYYNVYYTNRLALYVKERLDVPMVMEMGMDHYTLKRVSWNPVFWIDRFVKRAMIRQLAGQSEMMFVISRKLKEELEEKLHLPCRILYKTPDTSRACQKYEGPKGTVRFLFTGNIYANRWKTLAMLAQELQRQDFGHLDIYTATPISASMRRALMIEGYSEIHPSVSQDKVIELQNSADVLVHAEAFDKANKLLVRCAISTKIMDYLSVGRCILAIGPDDISSIEYLSEHDLALIASSAGSLSDVISRLKQQPSIISHYSAQGVTYTKVSLDAQTMGRELFDDLQGVINHYHGKRQT